MTNTTKAWLLLIPAILVEVTASLALKGALERPGLYVVVVIGYLSGFVLLAKILRTGMALGVPTVSGELPVSPSLPLAPS